MVSSVKQVHWLISRWRKGLIRRLKVCIVLHGNPSQNCRVSPVINNPKPNSNLSCDRQRHPYLNLSQVVQYLICLFQRDRRLSWPKWLVICWDGLHVCKMWVVTQVSVTDWRLQWMSKFITLAILSALSAVQYRDEVCGICDCSWETLDSFMQHDVQELCRVVSHLIFFYCAFLYKFY